MLFPGYSREAGCGPSPTCHLPCSSPLEVRYALVCPPDTEKGATRFTSGALGPPSPKSQKLIFQVPPSMSWYGHHHALTHLLHGAMDRRLCFSSVVNYSQRPTEGGWCKQEGYTGAEGLHGEVWEAPLQVVC